VWLVYVPPSPRARQRVFANIICEASYQPGTSGRPSRPFGICSSDPVRVHVLEWIGDWRPTRITRAHLSISEHFASGSFPDRTCLFGSQSAHFRVVANDSHLHWCHISVLSVSFTLVSEGWHTQAKAKNKMKAHSLRSRALFPFNRHPARPCRERVRVLNAPIPSGRPPTGAGCPRRIPRRAFPTTL
jgi:hypothetical protein